MAIMINLGGVISTWIFPYVVSPLFQKGCHFQHYTHGDYASAHRATDFLAQVSKQAKGGENGRLAKRAGALGRGGAVQDTGRPPSKLQVLLLEILALEMGTI